jgi:hypothetical protein
LFVWRKAFLASDDLEPSTRLVLLVIACHMDKNGNDSYPSQERLARETGLARRSVWTHIQEAVAKGWLKVSGRGLKGQAWKTHQYEIHYPKGCATVAQRSGKKVVQLTTEGCATDDRKVVQPLHTSTSGRNPPTYPGKPGGKVGGFFSENQNPKAKPKPSAEGKTYTPSIDGGFSKETATRLGDFIADVLEKTGHELPVPRRRELAALDGARREHGDEVWWRALWDFARRPQGFDGLNAPWSLLIGQLDTAVKVATHEVELEWRERVMREYEQQEAKRRAAWRCPDCGKPAAEGCQGWGCGRCGRLVDDSVRVRQEVKA